MESQNIEQLFKESFENFEVDVNPHVWGQVQGNIPNVVSLNPNLTIGKIAASIGLVSLGIVVASIWHFVTDNKETPNIKARAPFNTEIIDSKSMMEKTAINELEFSDNNQKIEDKNAEIPEILLKEENSNKSIVKDNHYIPDNQSKIIYNNSLTNHLTAKENNTTSILKSSNNLTGLNTESAKVKIKNLPVVNIFSNTTIGNAPLTVEFTNNGSAQLLTWDFGDGILSNEKTPTHTFTKAGIYSVVLMAKNSSNRHQINIEVTQISEILNVPNIFTPNTDGENDIFYFEMKNINSVSVGIFNGQQKVIYDWNLLGGNWNGRLKDGSDAPEGNYYYTINAYGTDGIKHSKKGSVYLKRN